MRFWTIQQCTNRQAVRNNSGWRYMGCRVQDYQKVIATKIETVEDLRTANPNRMRQQFSIVLERTIKDLNGIPCIELDEAGTPRQ